MCIQYQVRLWECPVCGEINESPRDRCGKCGLIECRECLECHKEIFVSADSLWHEGITGMDAYTWNDEYEDEEFVGYICFECAFKLANEGKGGISCAGQLAPEFWYN